jgi:8-oxo-dGTP pyrophosphatase MutT (NUDIX family)
MIITVCAVEGDGAVPIAAVLILLLGAVTQH